MSSNAYLTVQKRAKTSIVVKKSRFISNVMPTNNQKEAETYIEKLKKEYWNATHNVYAYSLGLNEDIQKFSDDGEPSGTAGKPILETIKAMEVKNVVIVVTRYFGGIMLGAGGLVRAYSDSAVEGLRAAKIIRRVKCDEFEVACDYSTYGKLEWEIRERSLVLADTSFAENVSLRVYVPLERGLNFKELILNLSSGEASVEWIGNVYIDDV